MSAVEGVHLDELRRRVQALSPEALADPDGDAAAELDAIEFEIQREEHRLKLVELARAEEAEREDAARLSELRHRQVEMETAKDEAGQRREVAFGRVEKTLGQLIDALSEVFRVQDDIDGICQQLGDLSDRRATRAAIENRITRRLRASGERYFMSDLDLPYGGAGMEPLVKVRSERCSVCGHGDVNAIEEALANGESQSAVAERYGLSRAAVTRHHAGHR